MARKSPIIRDSVTVTKQAELDHLAEFNQQRKAEIERDQKVQSRTGQPRQAPAGANTKRRKGSHAVEAIIADYLDPEIRALGDAMDAPAKPPRGAVSDTSLTRRRRLARRCRFT
jgi:hypothetical protein